MTTWTFAADGEPVSLPDARRAGDTLVATVEHPVYARIRDDRVFGPTRVDTEGVEPIVAGEPVRLVLSWIGEGPPPDGPDARGRAGDWRLLEATQDDGAGVRVGYSTRRPDRITDAVLTVLLEDGWEAVADPGGPVQAHHPGRTPSLDVTIWVDTDRELVVVLADLGVEPGTRDRAELTELAAQRTHRMDVGAVDLTPEGRVRIRQGLDVEGVEVTGALLRGALTAVVHQAELWWPELHGA